MEHGARNIISVVANNNADLCQAVFSAHGQEFHRSPNALLHWSRPPPYYPNYVTLSPGGVEQTASDLGALARCFHGNLVVKDSFCELELTTIGFKCLIDAEWLYRKPAGTVSVLPDGWCKIESADDLRTWEKSWKRNGSPTERYMFPSLMLSMPDIAFFGKKTDLGFEAGCVANLSERCIGLSNVFSAEKCRRAQDFADAGACAATLGPQKSLVGYDSGNDLKIMRDLGFRSIGKLRVWIADPTKC